MKAQFKFISIAILLSIGVAASAQEVAVDKSDSTGLPGDHFSLPGALELFKNAKNLEDYEKLLNEKENNVNNLDLNQDGKIDYIRVIDNVKNGAHAIALQVPVNKTEFQDIAVIEIEKQGAEEVSIQIVGDEDVYGENVIYEPNNEKEVVPSNTKGGPSANYYSAHFWFNVWYWPSIQYVYAPSYVVWVSPWYWDYYPRWWSPWSPYSWRYYYHHSHHYYDHYYHSYNHYGNHAYSAYHPHRRTSDLVVNRHRTDLTHYRNNRSNNRRDNISTSPRNDRNNNINNGRSSNNTNYSKPRDNNRSEYRGTDNKENRNNSTINSSNRNNTQRDSKINKKEDRNSRSTIKTSEKKENVSRGRQPNPGKSNTKPSRSTSRSNKTR